MVLACLIGLGADIDKLNAMLASLAVEPLSIVCKEAVDHGINGLQVHVEAPVEAHHHRRLGHIRTILENAGIEPGVTARAMAAFTRLAEAEAKVHNSSVDKVHFHEVGALDAIADITGSAAAMEQLNIGSVSFGPLPVGCGTVKTAHGLLPVPVPATVEMLQGWQLQQTGEPFELITPTGAALLSTWAVNATGQHGRMLRSATACGHRKLNNRPNILRAMLFAPEDDLNGKTDCCTVLETQLDDQSGEGIGAAVTKLLQAGALDVFTTPVFMKKQRPGVALTVICQTEDSPRMKEYIFRETTTFGIRESITSRTTLQREFKEVDTAAGKISLKIGSLNGESITLAPEYEDCLRCAEASGLPLRKVQQMAVAAASHTLSV